jgi:magnesium-dependent phosphatase 1
MPNLQHLRPTYTPQTHITPPVKRKGDAINSLQDRYALPPFPIHILTKHHPVHSHGTELGFYKEVPSVLSDLKRDGIHIAAASRTHAPDL